jgi:ribosomal protein S27E
MASALVVTCSGCQTRYQVPPVLAGKKIRCKNCGGVSQVPAGGAAKVIAAREAPASPKATEAEPSAAASPLGPQAPRSEEWGAITAYTVIREKDKPRCPHCAHDMEEGEIVCLNCGYNTMTRERLPNRVLEPVTGWDYALWLLPGILCALLSLYFLFSVQAVFTHFPYVATADFIYYTQDNKAIPCYVSIFWLTIAYFCGKFAVKRLILNPHPPEVEKHLHKQEEEED